MSLSADMSGLLEEIQSIDQDAAQLLERAEICTDSEIQSLSQEDLQELFPGINKLKLRSTIFETIQKKQKLISVPLKHQKQILPDGNFWGALSSNNTFVDQLPTLKAWKDEVEKLPSFVEAHIKLMENLMDAQPKLKFDRGENCALLEEIRSINPEAAHVLSENCADLYIQLLTRNDLHELFPKTENFNLRRTIFGIIHKQKPTHVFPKEPKSVYPGGNLWGDAHSSSKTLADHLPSLKAWMDEVGKWHSFLEAHVKLVENTTKAQPQQKPERDERCALMEEIYKINPESVRVLRRAKICTNSEIQSLSRQDLNELFPGVENLHLRRTLFEMIHKQKPTAVFVKESKPLFLDGIFSDSLSSKTLADHLPILKDWKDEIEKGHSFLEAHIKLVENTTDTQPGQKPARGVDKGEKSQSNKGHEESNRRVEQQKSSGENKKLKSENVYSVPLQPATKHTRAFCGLQSPQKAQEILKYKMVVSGETFNAHNQLLREMESSVQGFNFVEVNGSQNSEESQIIIVFCPVVSRVGTDVSEAMKAVPGNKPVILVLMHHSYEARHVPSVKAWGNNDNIVLHVNVFYHETVNGLVNCNQNKTAMLEIRNKMIEMRK